ncbi:unnamed protein product [Cuscuta campestris]|uniref:Uncharacterized protein n=1 Tax=Cuscuta campestris TaxID=132261 RepID=A0A484M2M8_9ASTE|nr:unnamed protein product [Cuscuta campestris]
MKKLESERGDRCSSSAKPTAQWGKGSGQRSATAAELSVAAAAAGSPWQTDGDVELGRGVDGNEREGER